MEDIIIWWALDKPSVTDYVYHDIFWGDEMDLPDEVLLNLTKVFNQRDDNIPNTYYWCTRYWTTHGINENNAYEGSWIMVDPVEEWRIALEQYWADIRTWDSLRSALQQAKDRWFISWYARLTDRIYQGKYALSIGQTIYTWTVKCDWKETLETGIFHWKESSYWHAFIIIWYNKDWFIARNSYWWMFEYDWIKWWFLIPWDMVEYLFTMYALIDMTDIDAVKAEKIRKDNESKERMKDMWIWNGLDWDQPVTRAQVAIMLDRLYQNILDK